MRRSFQSGRTISRLLARTQTVRVLATLGAIATCVHGAAFAQGPTTGWRGDGSGKFPHADPPTKWTKESENILWRLELKQGYSSPVLCQAGKQGQLRLFVAAEPAELLSIDPKTGAVLWRERADYPVALSKEKAAKIAETYAKFDAEKRALNKKYDPIRKADPTSPAAEEYKQKRKELSDRQREFQRQYPQEKRGGAGNAAATVICDGQRVFVVFGTGIVAAYSLDGTRLWARHLEAPPQNFGHSTSPIIAGGRLIVHIDTIVAIEPKSGEIAWQAELKAHHGTPAVAHVGGEDLIITPAGAIVKAVDGEVLAEKQFSLSRNSPLVEDDILYVQGSGRGKALRLPPSLDEPFALELLWESTATRDQRMSSALLHDGLLYGAGRKGIIDVVDAKTGMLVYKQRVEIGEIFSSPAMAGDLIYLGGRDGKTLVFRPGRKYDEIAINESDRVTTNPVFFGNRMYLRTDQHLLCIRK